MINAQPTLTASIGCLMDKTTSTITYSTLKVRFISKNAKSKDLFEGLESLFGKKNNKPKINLDCHGDSMPKYAIYQLQTSRLQYEVPH